VFIFFVQKVYSWGKSLSSSLEGRSGQTLSGLDAVEKGEMSVPAGNRIPFP
jgi:hypothetical protein